MSESSDVPLALESAAMPLVAAVQNLRERRITALHTPGHKGRLLPDLAALLACGGSADVPSMYATDNTFYPHQAVLAAERRAAELVGSERTRYLAGGSSSGVLAMYLATCQDGRPVILARDGHKSIQSALVLTGARPVYLPAIVHPSCGVLPVTESDVRAALDEHPDATAVQLTRPTYYGLGGEITPIARLCRERGVPLLIDEAHGAHLTFFQPRTAAPSSTSSPRSSDVTMNPSLVALRPALDRQTQGPWPDVVVQSVHKTLGSLVGSAQAHLPPGSRVTAERFGDALNLVQSTSPSYLLLQSLDIVRHHWSMEGDVAFAAQWERAVTIRQRLAAIPGVRPLTAIHDPAGRVAGLDPLRLVIDVRELTLTGLAVEPILRERFAIEDEFADMASVILVLTPFDPPEVDDRLVEAMATLSREAEQDGRLRAGELPDLATETPRPLPQPVVALTPREVWHRRKEAVPVGKAAGRISGETIVSYPPGIPIVAAGEIFDQETLDLIAALHAGEADMRAHDPTLETVLAVAS